VTSPYPPHLLFIARFFCSCRNLLECQTPLPPNLTLYPPPGVGVCRPGVAASPLCFSGVIAPPRKKSCFYPFASRTVVRRFLPSNSPLLLEPFPRLLVVCPIVFFPPSLLLLACFEASTKNSRGHVDFFFLSVRDVSARDSCLEEKKVDWALLFRTTARPPISGYNQPKTSSSASSCTFFFFF